MELNYKLLEQIINIDSPTGYCNKVINYLETVVKEFETRFLEAINDDLNMPQALSVIWDVVKYEKKSKILAELLLKFDSVLGLNIENEDKIDLPEEIIRIVEERKQARINKDWTKSDELRDKLISLGYTVKDTKDGMEVNKN